MRRDGQDESGRRSQDTDQKRHQETHFTQRRVGIGTVQYGAGWCGVDNVIERRRRKKKMWQANERSTIDGSIYILYPISYLCSLLSHLFSSSLFFLLRIYPASYCLLSLSSDPVPGNLYLQPVSSILSTLNLHPPGQVVSQNWTKTTRKSRHPHPSWYPELNPTLGSVLSGLRLGSMDDAASQA